MSFLLSLRNRFSAFMQHRNGVDSLGKFLLFVWLILAILNGFFHSLVLLIPELLLAFLFFFRFFSKNTVRRRRENAAYYEINQKFRRSVQKFNVRLRDRKLYHFFRCPQCRADIRMPRKVGTFQIRCRRCGHTFQKSFKK